MPQGKDGKEDQNGVDGVAITERGVSDVIDYWEERGEGYEREGKRIFRTG